MSESQKLFASLSGALVAHLLLLVLAFPKSKSEGSSVLDDRREVKEITIRMGDLMERVEPEEPELPEILKNESKTFVSTDLNAPEDRAPKDAKYESDRNTSAASRLRPDQDLPGMAGVPTMRGDSPLSHLSLVDREYVEGPIDEEPGSAGQASPVTSVPPSSSPPRMRPSVTPAVEELASMMPEPKSTKAMRSLGRDDEAREKSFIDPQARLATDLARETMEPENLSDKEEETMGEGEARLDPLPSETQEGLVESSSSDSLNEINESRDETLLESKESPSVDKMADEGLFGKGFSPEEHQSKQNGSSSRYGADAVDAEGTAMGKYKKQVRDLISERWHRYRQEKADFVTWGILKIEFNVSTSGKVQNLRITKNEANSMLAEFSLRAIQEANLPPMPEEVSTSVGPEGLAIQYDIIIY